MNNLYGFAIYVDENIFDKRWVFPKDRYIEFGPEDESYCRLLGVGHEETTPGVKQIGNALYMHPLRYEQMKKLIGERANALADQCFVRAVEETGWSRPAPPAHASTVTGGITRKSLLDAMKLMKNRPVECLPLFPVNYPLEYLDAAGKSNFVYRPLL